MNEETWWPSLEEYNPNISKQKWTELLKDEKVFTFNSLCMMKRFLHHNGEASCIELANKYGRTYSAYISFSFWLASRIHDKTNCAMPPEREENARFWPILYVGRSVSKSDVHEGTYVWKLRPELKLALEEMNILNDEKYPLFDKKHDWKTLLAEYKKLLQNEDTRKIAFDDEEYKWKTISDCKDLKGKEVLSYLTDANSNLFDHFALGEAKQLLAKNDFNKIYEELINDNLDLNERLSRFKNSILEAYSETDKNRLIKDERSASVFLTCHNSEKYTFYKDSYYTSLCKYLEISSETAGNKYSHYLTLINDFEKAVVSDSTIMDFYKTHTENYEQSTKLIAQNIIYVLFEHRLCTVSCIMANIAWNENGWKLPSDNKTNFGYQKEGNVPHESWNFDFDNPRNTANNIYGFAQFTYPPKTAEQDKFLIFFRASNKIVGIYGNTEIKKEPEKFNEISSVNLIASRSLCVAFENYIDDTDKQFLFGKQRVGMVGFNTITKENSLEIIEKAIALNPNQKKQLEVIKDWLKVKITTEGDECMEKVNEYKELLKNTYNLILHGAPGTGKTHLAKEIAESMGAEWEMLQFHPSFDYTDFVEGLRPVNNDDNGQIGFERKDGVFKKFCEKALLSNPSGNDILKELNDNPTVWKVSLEGTGDNPTRADCMKNGYIRLGWHEYGDVADFSKFDGYTEHGGSVVLVAFQSKMKIGDIVLSCWSSTEIDAVGVVAGDYEYRSEGGDYPRYRTVKWLVKGIRENIVEKNRGKTLTLASVYRLSVSIQDVVEIVNKYNKESGTVKKDFVFIIDEINRGEMSKIFGELFFSIDPGYRGKKGLIKTQYQNLIKENNIFYEGFYVPENVYIIGTMNDIDRSVESMDFAFRRRFTFKEIKANENLGMLDELNESIREKARQTLLGLNKAIWDEDTKSGIEGLSSAYHIGGAYFLKLKELGGDFDKLWEYHLEGLLREYLRGMEDAESNLEKLHLAYKNGQEV
jgi:hypothetical protein